MRHIPTLVVRLTASLFVASVFPTALPALAGEEPVTFSRQVSRVLQARCQTCHRPGGAAPFSLLTYADARPNAPFLAEAASSRVMPPWKARPDCGGGFVDERRLTDREIETIVRWAGSGAPEGDPAELPEPLVFPDTWQLGEPDVTFVNSHSGYDVPANRGHDIFRCFSIDTGFDVDRYITAFEILPGKGVYVHHALVYLDTESQSIALDEKDPGPGYDNLSGPGFDAPLIAGWNPGARPVHLYPGTAIRIPKGSRLVVQVHYASETYEQHDRTFIGVHFARTPVLRTRETVIPRNESFVIPANDPRYRVDAWTTIHEDLTLTTIAPHMHKLGIDQQVEAFLPDGSSVCLVGVDYDINWQGTFVYRTPLRLPEGTRVNVRCFYDNTAENHKNPNRPPKDVPWYPAEDTEMCFCTLGVSSDAQRLEPSTPLLLSAEVRGSHLSVSGTGIAEGALLLVDGALVRDSSTRKSVRRSRPGVSGEDVGPAEVTTVSSADDWRRHVGGSGGSFRVVVLNPDGVSTEAVALSLVD